MKWFKKIQYILLYLMGFLLIGAASLVTGSSGWRDTLTTRFYIDLVLTYSAIICILIATILKIVDDFKAKDKEYNEGINEIQDFAAHTYIPSIFTKFCDHINSKRKRKQFEHNIKQKIFELENDASDEDLHIWVNGTLEEKRSNKYCKKRNILEMQLQDDYITKNLPVIRVEYDKITSGIALSGYYSKEDALAPNEFITKHHGKKIAKDNAPRLLFGFAASFFTSSVILDVAFTPNAIIQILVKLFVLCYQTFISIRYANTWNTEVTLKDIRFRKGIVMEYKIWIKQELERQKNAKLAETQSLEDSAKELERAISEENQKLIFDNTDLKEVTTDEY